MVETATSADRSVIADDNTTITATMYEITIAVAAVALALTTRAWL
jgi:hypothetical protein